MIVRREGKRGISYQVRVKGNDYKDITKTFKLKKDAERFEAQLKNKKLGGDVFLADLRKLTLDDYFWNHWTTQSRSKVSRGWRKTQEQMYRDYISPLIGKLEMIAIKPFHIQKVLNHCNDLKRSPQTVLHVYSLLHKMFGDAIEDFQILNTSPVFKKYRPSVPKKETEYLTIEEAKKLLLHAKGKPFEIAIWLQVYCGLRVGEVQYLEKKHIDLTDSWIKVRGTYDRKSKTHKHYPKGKKWFTLRIPKELLDILKMAIAEDSNRYVASNNPEGFLSYHSYYKALKRYCIEAGVNYKIATHGLRHSTSGIYIKHGATADDLQTLFQHSSSSVTERYIHQNGSEKVNKIADNILLFPEKSEDEFLEVSQKIPNLDLGKQEG